MNHQNILQELRLSRAVQQHWDLFLILSTFLVAMSVSGICLAAPEEQVEDSVKDIRTYTLSILFREINDSISKKFGITDWGFYPKKVCEVNGASLT